MGGLSKMRRLTGALVAMGSVAVLSALAMAFWKQHGHHELSLATGRIIYDQHCAACHGRNLEGQPNWRERPPNGRLPAPPHDASGHTWHHPDDVLFGITKHGIGAYAPAGYESDMPGFDGKLTDDEIRAVLAFIKSTWPPDIQARQAAMSHQSNEQAR
jgi:mono/diheme cytochrome c family protein